MILATTVECDPDDIKWLEINTNITIEEHQKSIIRFYELLEKFMKIKAD